MYDGPNRGMDIAKLSEADKYLLYGLLLKLQKLNVPLLSLGRMDLDLQP